MCCGVVVLWCVCVLGVVVLWVLWVIGLVCQSWSALASFFAQPLAQPRDHNVAHPPDRIHTLPLLQKLMQKLERKAQRRAAAKPSGGGGGGGGPGELGDADVDWVR